MSEDCGANCQDALERLEAFLDGELPDVSVGDISQHLADCYPCADRADFESQLRAIVRRDCVESAPDSLVSRIRARLADSAEVTAE
jgi:mycothiol system anti-sigma-R factor